MKLCGILIALALALGAHAQNEPAPVPKSISLWQVRSIYVSPMDDQLDGFIVQRLLKWKDIRVSYKAEDADAILMGAGEIRRPTRGDGMETGTMIHSASVSLADAKTKTPIWAAEKGKGNSFVTGLTAGELGSVSGVARSESKLADQIVDQLRHDWQKAQPKKTP